MGSERSLSRPVERKAQQLFAQRNCPAVDAVNVEGGDRFHRYRSWRDPPSTEPPGGIGLAGGYIDRPRQNRASARARCDAGLHEVDAEPGPDAALGNGRGRRRRRRRATPADPRQAPSAVGRRAAGERDERSLNPTRDGAAPVEAAGMRIRIRDRKMGRAC